MWRVPPAPQVDVNPRKGYGEEQKFLMPVPLTASSLKPPAHPRLMLLETTAVPYNEGICHASHLFLRTRPHP